MLCCDCLRFWVPTLCLSRMCLRIITLSLSMYLIIEARQKCLRHVPCRTCNYTCKSWKHSEKVSRWIDNGGPSLHLNCAPTHPIYIPLPPQASLTGMPWRSLMEERSKHDTTQQTSSSGMQKHQPCSLAVWHCMQGKQKRPQQPWGQKRRKKRWLHKLWLKTLRSLDMQICWILGWDLLLNFVKK